MQTLNVPSVRSLSLVSYQGFPSSGSKHLKLFPWGPLKSDGPQYSFGSFLMFAIHTATDGCSSKTLFTQVRVLQIPFIHIHEPESPLFQEVHGVFSKKREVDLPGINKQETQRLGIWLPIRAFQTAALTPLSHQGREGAGAVGTDKPTLDLWAADLQRPSQIEGAQGEVPRSPL